MGNPIDVSWPGNKDKKIGRLQDDLDDLVLDNIDLMAENNQLTQIILEFETELKDKG